MTAEPAVPVARLEKLWKRLRQQRGVALADARKYERAGRYVHRDRMEHQAFGFWLAARDLPAIIDEAKKGEGQ